MVYIDLCIEYGDDDRREALPVVGGSLDERVVQEAPGIRHLYGHEVPLLVEEGIVRHEWFCAGEAKPCGAYGKIAAA